MNPVLLLLPMVSADVENAFKDDQSVRSLQPDVVSTAPERTVYQALHARHALAYIQRFYSSQWAQAQDMHLHIFFDESTEFTFDEFLAGMERNAMQTIRTPKTLWLAQVVTTAFAYGVPLVWLVKSRNVDLPSSPDTTFEIPVLKRRCTLAFSRGNMRSLSA